MVNTTNNTLAITWALIATALFAIAAVMAKVGVKQYPLLQILFFRQLVVLLSVLPVIASSFPRSLETAHPKIHVVRLVGSFIALSCGIWAVSVLPLTTAITLGFTSVFFIALLAMVFLKEAVSVNRFAAILVGFIGVVVVMRPGADDFASFYAFIPILGALGAAVAIVSVRKLSQQESTATLLAYQAVFVGVLAGIPLLWLWKAPDVFGVFFLLAMGAAAAGGQWFGVKALRLGEASLVGNIQYVQLIYAALFGFVIFGEVPTLHTLIGGAIIIGSSVYLLHRESLAKSIKPV